MSGSAASVSDERGQGGEEDPEVQARVRKWYQLLQVGRGCGGQVARSRVVVR